MNCSFCDKIIGIGKGLISVKSDGTISYYCSSKCEKNSKIRKAKNVKWTGLYHKRKSETVAKK
ncbi:MAG: 50S ribosomal protein L24 [archaeon]